MDDVAWYLAGDNLTKNAVGISHGFSSQLGTGKVIKIRTWPNAPVAMSVIVPKLTYIVSGYWEILPSKIMRFWFRLINWVGVTLFQTGLSLSA
jgi:hypothetical protein